MSVFTGMDDNKAELGDLLSVELFSGITTNLDYLIDCVTPGKIIPILYGFAGVPAPDPKFWQLCDGSAITDENSPLRGGNTPDMATLGRYFRGFDSIGNVGKNDAQSGIGSNTKNLRHNHGGATSAQDYVGNNFMTNNDDEKFVNAAHGTDHTHSVANDLGTAVNFEPVHVRVLFYMKIN